MELTAAEAAAAFLFTTLSTFVGVVLRSLWAENKELKLKLDESNKASRDLISIQADILRSKGVQIIPTPPAGEN